MKWLARSRLFLTHDGVPIDWTAAMASKMTKGLLKGSGKWGCTVAVCGYWWGTRPSRMLISLLLATQCSKLPSEEKSVLGNSAILKVLMVSSMWRSGLERMTTKKGVKWALSSFKGAMPLVVLFFLFAKQTSMPWDVPFSWGLDVFFLNKIMCQNTPDWCHLALALPPWSNLA